MAPPLEPPLEGRLLLTDGLELTAPDERMLPPEDRGRLLIEGALERGRLEVDGDRTEGRLLAEGDRRAGGRLVADGERVGGRLLADGDRVFGEAPVVGGLALGSRTVGPVELESVDGFETDPPDGGATSGREVLVRPLGVRGDKVGRSPPVDSVPPEVGAPKIVGR